MNAEEMWKEYTKEHPTEEAYEAWSFCGGGEIGDRLAGLVLEGKKTATASSYISYETIGDELPKEGSFSVVLFDNQEAACIIKTDKVSLVPFDEVSARHAYMEGEGDRSLEYWRRVHEEAFTPDYAEAGKEFDHHGLMVLEEFHIEYRETDGK